MCIHRAPGKGILTGLLLLLLAIAINPLHAKTLHLEKWGADSNAPGCSRSNPCLSLGTAVASASRNDRIIVGPGIYFIANTQVLDVEGLKLESTAGRYATTIQQVNASRHVFSITAGKVQLGKKGKGFTLNGAYTTGFAAIEIDVAGDLPAIKIQGNRIGAPRPVDAEPGISDRSNHYGINVLNGGGKLQLAYNLIHNNVVAFNCSDCDRMVVRHNRVTNNLASGFFIGSSAAVTFKDNVISNNGGNGIGSSMTQDTLKVQNNVFEYNGVHGLDLQFAGAVNLNGIISSRNGSSGIALNQATDASPATVRHFLALYNDNTGLFLNHTDGARIENNFALSNGTDGIHLQTNAVARSLRNNSTIANGDCELKGINDLVRYEYSKHFFVPNAGDTCDGDFTGTESNRPAKINLNRTRGLVGG